MADPYGPQRGAQEGPPTDFAQTTPAQVHTSEYSFLLQCVMDNQKVLGALENAAKSLDGEVQELRTSVNSIKRNIWIAIGIFIGSGAVFGFFLDRGIDKIIDALKIT